MRIFLLVLLLTSCAHKLTPKVENNWDAVTNQILESKSSSLDEIRKLKPDLFLQMSKDKEDKILFDFWGESLNVDSNVKKAIVDEKIISDLHRFFNLKVNNEIVHAGITHTYGYLFSNLNTPYGKKRKRWVDLTLNQAFGFFYLNLSPYTPTGTLLSNLTYFAGKIAFEKKINKEKLDELKNVSDEIKRFDFDEISVTKIEEKTSDLKIYTTLVSFINGVEDTNSFLLIYSFDDGKNEKLVTVFPVNQETYLRLTEDKSLGVGKKIAPRYNAHFVKLPEEGILGEKRIILVK